MVSSSFFIREISLPPTITLPEVGISSPPSICKRVDFPLPDVPTIAVKLPFSMEKLMPSTAFTRFSPFP
jgi:hypothetical protein